jgi:hypothetical protein
LKKEAKTLALWQPRWIGINVFINKSFLVLFFKKEPLPLSVAGDPARHRGE